MDGLPAAASRLSSSQRPRHLPVDGDGRLHWVADSLFGGRHAVRHHLRAGRGRAHLLPEATLLAEVDELAGPADFHHLPRGDRVDLRRPGDAQLSGAADPPLRALRARPAAGGDVGGLSVTAAADQVLDRLQVHAAVELLPLGLRAVRRRAGHQQHLLGLHPGPVRGPFRPRAGVSVLRHLHTHHAVDVRNPLRQLGPSLSRAGGECERVVLHLLPDLQVCPGLRRVECS
mmetsp:Transcript_46339/g.110142  ORF Transcript_46339/g.110142 Transcript_46339/m.110142 type:complete len:230 (+) Transcript_46339:136-825(+)